MIVDEGPGEDIVALYRRMQRAFTTEGPVALVNKRVMAPGVPGIEGSTHGHDVIKKEHAIAYLESRERPEAAAFLATVQAPKGGAQYRGSTKEFGSNRSEFGEIISGILNRMPKDERAKRLLVIDSDLEGSTGLKAIRAAHPDVYVLGGVMERGNFSAAAGFGFDEGKQGIFSTFSAFLEMVISEATMARLNKSNLLCHFSHAGVDEIADNTCHYGINIFFAHNELVKGHDVRLYFPADALQLKAVVERVFDDTGLRYVFTTRSKVPLICKPDGSRMYDAQYSFQPGKDEIVRKGAAGYVVSYGELLYRALDAVERARAEGIDVGLINKPTLNVVDEDMMATAGKAPFVLVVEGQNVNTGLGVRYGTWFSNAAIAPAMGAWA